MLCALSVHGLAREQEYCRLLQSTAVTHIMRRRIVKRNEATQEEPKYSIVLDLSFEDFMTDKVAPLHTTHARSHSGFRFSLMAVKEIFSLVQQVGYTYAINRRTQGRPFRTAPPLCCGCLWPPYLCLRLFASL
jgi:hypothetical protein